MFSSQQVTVHNGHNDTFPEWGPPPFVSYPEQFESPHSAPTILGPDSKSDVPVPKSSRFAAEADLKLLKLDQALLRQQEARQAV
ncbi:MAG TPA: hypothetical protein VNE00_04735 [Paraburkholderia sp.]|jgi:hypothetical protein|nr:hypothetical protein [Paraburkholderia sp.]